MKWRTWNWWKIGFFVMLIVFEVTREMYVLAADPYPGVPFNDVIRSSDGSIVTAEGQWERTGGGDALAPTSVDIECWRDLGECILATEMHGHGSTISRPFIDRMPATFTPTGVEFTDDAPVCSTWIYRIDTVRHVTVGVGTSRQGPLPPICGTPGRTEMHLIGQSDANFRAWRGRHFIPIMQILGVQF